MPIIIRVWRPKPNSREVGHVSMQTGVSYISFWPDKSRSNDGGKESLKAGGGVFVSLDQDRKDTEKREPDNVIELNSLDEHAIDEEYIRLSHKARSKVSSAQINWGLISTTTRETLNFFPFLVIDVMSELLLESMRPKAPLLEQYLDGGYMHRVLLGDKPHENLKSFAQRDRLLRNLFYNERENSADLIGFSSWSHLAEHMEDTTNCADVVYYLLHTGGKSSLPFQLAARTMSATSLSGWSIRVFCAFFKDHSRKTMAKLFQRVAVKPSDIEKLVKKTKDFEEGFGPNYKWFNPYALKYSEFAEYFAEYNAFLSLSHIIPNAICYLLQISSKTLVPFQLATRSRTIGIFSGFYKYHSAKIMTRVFQNVVVNPSNVEIAQNRPKP